LNELDISYNKISTLEKGWPIMNSLRRLFLTGNNLGGNLNGGAFRNLQSLAQIGLAKNNLTEVKQCCNS